MQEAVGTAAKWRDSSTGEGWLPRKISFIQGNCSRTIGGRAAAGCQKSCAKHGSASGLTGLARYGLPWTSGGCGTAPGMSNRRRRRLRPTTRRRGRAARAGTAESPIRPEKMADDRGPGPCIFQEELPAVRKLMDFLNNIQKIFRSGLLPISTAGWYIRLKISAAVGRM